MKTSLILGSLALFNLFFTVFYQWYVVTQLGLGVETDALFASMTIPQLIMSVVTNSLVHVLVPLLSINDREAIKKTTWSFFVGITILFVLLAIILKITSFLWIPLILPGFSESRRLLTSQLIGIQLINMILTANVSVLWSANYAQNRFISTEVSQIIAGITGTLFLFWALPKYGIVSAAWTLVIISSLKILFLFPVLGKWRKPVLNSPQMKEAWRRIIPLLLGTIYYKTDPIFDRLLASFAPAGSISTLYFAQQIYMIGTQVIQKGITAPLIPRLARYAEDEKWSLFKQTYHQKLKLVASVCFVGILALILIGKPFFQLFIGYGGITQKNIQTIWLLMIALTGFFTAGAMGDISASSFFAIGDTKTPVRISMITYTIYIPLKFIIFYFSGLMGMAITISIYYMTNLIWQIINFQRQYLSQK